MPSTSACPLGLHRDAYGERMSPPTVALDRVRAQQELPARVASTATYAAARVATVFRLPTPRTLPSMFENPTIFAASGPNDCAARLLDDADALDRAC
jgi:hypothetical protein